MGRTHPNVLKLRKQKRNGRRAYLTSKYSLIHVPRSVGSSHIPEDAQPLFVRKYASWEDSEYLNTIFPGVKRTSVTRKYALDQAEELRLLSLVEHEDVCDCYTLADYPIQQKRLTFCFNRKKTVIFFVEVDYLNKIVRKSKVYGGEDRAMFDFKHKRIKWHEELTLESLTLVLPRRE